MPAFPTTMMCSFVDWAFSMPVLPLSVALCFLCSLRVFIDIYYFLRLGWVILTEGILSSKTAQFLDEHKRSVIVLPTDLDHMGHMNNSRYNRECDFSRHGLFSKSGFMKFVYGNFPLALAATTMRFRKSMNPFDTAWCTAKVVYWEGRSIYIEQTFSRKSDGFLYAVGYAKMVCTTATMQEVLDKYGFTGEHPKPDEDLLSWMQYIEQSSKRFRPKAI